MAMSLAANSIDLRAQALAVPAHGAALEVSLLTISPGHHTFQWLGHSALLVANRESGESRVYQYGVFNLNPETVRSAATGEVHTFANAIRSDVATARYLRDGRSVHLQEFALTDAQKLDLLRLLNNDVIGKRLRQRYNAVTDNCSTRPRDLLDRVTGGALREAGAVPMKATLNETVARYPIPPPIRMGIEVVLKKEIAAATTLWKAAALPSNLENLAARTVITDNAGPHPLVARSWKFGDEPARRVTSQPHRAPAELGLMVTLFVAAFVPFPKISRSS